MLTPELHPWQEAPVGLLRFARDTSRSAVRLNQLVAFLLLDICVETTMRTFLSLPDGIAPAKIKYFERRKFSEGNFHDLTRGVEAACVTAIAPPDLHYSSTITPNATSCITKEVESPSHPATSSVT
jgi:hypothetical protein